MMSLPTVTAPHKAGYRLLVVLTDYAIRNLLSTYSNNSWQAVTSSI